jgi:hypothetical protein
MTPTIIVSDTGSLTDSVGKLLDPNATRNPNRAIGLVGGAVVGYLIAPKRSKLVAMLVGTLGGYILANETDPPIPPTSGFPGI